MSFIESTCFDVKETGVLPDFFTLFFGAIRTRTHNALPQTLNALKSEWRERFKWVELWYTNNTIWIATR